MAFNHQYFITGDRTITVVVNGETLSVKAAQQPEHGKVLDWILEGRQISQDEVLSLLVPLKALVQTYGCISVASGEVLYDGTPIRGALVDRIVANHAVGADVAPVALLADRIYANPANWAEGELYDWLRSSNLPITSDGHILAYKRITNEYLDFHTGSFDNSVGTYVSVPRSEVDTDRERTCSYGLHFCSESYLSSFYSSSDARTVLVKVDPADVVSIPTDYNHAKGRTSSYLVVGEVDHRLLSSTPAGLFWPEPVADPNQSNWNSATDDWDYSDDLDDWDDSDDSDDYGDFEYWDYVVDRDPELTDSLGSVATGTQYVTPVSITEAAQAAKGDINEAADALRVTPRGLRKWLSRLNMRP